MSGDPGLFATIYSTRSLRRFTSHPVPDEVLFQLFDAAIRAGSGRNRQDWRFVIVRDPATKAVIGEAAAHAWRTYQPDYAEHPERMNELPRTQRLSLRSVEHLANHLAETPVLVLACGLAGAHSTPGGSTFPAVQNLMLAARALGLGASVFNLGLGNRAELASRLQIPANNEIKCLLALGYPTDRHGPVSRKPVRDVVFDERFGETWAFAAEQPDEGWQARWLA